MSTDQVVSRYPQEWLDAAWAAVRVKRRSFASDTSLANAVLAALEEVGALLTHARTVQLYTEGRSAAKKVARAAADYLDSLDRVRTDEYPLATYDALRVAVENYRRVEVPDA